MAEHKREPCLGDEVGEPVPREESIQRRPRDRYDRARHDLEKGLGASLHMAVQGIRTRLIHDADVHGPGVPVDATIKLVRLGGESPEVELAYFGLLPRFIGKGVGGVLSSPPPSPGPGR